VARCKVYEIKGPDPQRTSGAERCVRDVAGEAVIDGRKYRICKHHQDSRWELFVDGGWLYAVDPEAKPTKKKHHK
jgi:hypothetical protein